MQSKNVLLVATLFALGCGSAPPPVEAPLISAAPLGDVSIVINQGGSIPMAYLVSITNQADIPISLRSVELSIVGGAPYRIRQRERFYPRTIAPGETSEVKVDVLLVSGGGVNASEEPVNIRARLSFGSDEGGFRVQKLFRAN